jgi:ribonuclease D
VITTAEELAEFLAEIEPLERVAIDTEADSLHCYFEKLCLIQISIPGREILVDPLAGFSIEPLTDLLSGKELILHGADYDLRLLRRAGNLTAGRIFDTMIAARLTGRTEFGLAALIAEHFGLALAKHSQKANWARRPLPPAMLEYAVNDTRYLLPLAQKLEEELRGLGRWEWFEQSCQKAIASASVVRERDIESLWRIKGSSDLRGREAAVLRALWHWRDDEARHADRPPFHILHNEQLIACARAFSSGSGDAPRHLGGSRLNRFLSAAAEAMRLPESEWPQPIRRNRVRVTQEQQRLFNVYKTKRDRVAQELGLDPSLIAPKTALEAVAADGGLAGERLMPWQCALLGIEKL